MTPQEAASHCEAIYERERVGGHCHCLTEWHNVSACIDVALASQNPWTVKVHADEAGAGGLAVILRGGAFRGSADDDQAARHAAQIEASRSVARRIIHPFVQRRYRVRVFLTVYDNLNSTKVEQLSAPYANHMAAVTTLSAASSEQVTATANALRAFLRHCETQRETFDAVVLTRFDLHFKVDFSTLLGDLQALHGIRFLWRELETGSRWRLIWSPSERQMANASEKTQAEWARVTFKMERTRNSTLVPRVWQSGSRTADTLHVFSFNFTNCFLKAVYVEMTRGWSSKQKKPPVTANPSAANTSAASGIADSSLVAPSPPWKPLQVGMLPHASPSHPMSSSHRHDLI